MIKLNKSQQPKILQDNSKQWTDEYLRALNSEIMMTDTIKNRYNHPDIKSALKKETHGKCVYCESKFEHVSYGDIEHILPKNEDARPDMYVEWNNLTLSCEQCNRSGKHTYYDPALPLINPYIDDPIEHFQDIGPLIFHIVGDERARITEKVLKINRSSLVDRRKEAIEKIEILLNSWEKEQNPNVKEILTHELREAAGIDKEFCSTIRSFLCARGFPV